MFKSKVEACVNKRVTVTLFNGDVYTGKLRKASTEELRGKNATLFSTKDRYFIEMDDRISHLFRSSHIAKLRLLACGIAVLEEV